MEYNDCRPVALDKCPRLRPIGLGEVLRRIIERAISSCVDVAVRLIGKLCRLCLRRTARIEHAICSLSSAFETDETEALLLIAATNASDFLNRATTLANVKILSTSPCPSLMNSYSIPFKLFIDRCFMESRGGCKQGDFLSRWPFVEADVRHRNHTNNPSIRILFYHSAVVCRWWHISRKSRRPPHTVRKLFENCAKKDTVMATK